MRSGEALGSVACRCQWWLGVLLGGHVQVGLEENLYLECGVHTSNGQLVEKAIWIIREMGARTLFPNEGRQFLKTSK